MAVSANIEIPILQEELILSVIRNVANVPFTASDLKAPTYEKLYSVYSGFICSLLNVSNEQITQVPLHVMETIAHTELSLEESIGHLLFVKALEYVFSACCINDFTMNDLVAPTRKRTRKLLSALVNYTQFMSQHEQMRIDVLRKLETLSTNQEVYTSKREHLKEKIAYLKCQRLEKQKAVQEMNLSALKAKQQEINDLKKQKEISNNIIKDDIEELQNMLTVARASKLIQQGKEAVDEHLSRGHNLVVKEKLYDEFGWMAPSALKLIKGIDEDVEKLSVLTHEMESIKDNLIGKSKNYKDIMSDTQNCQRLIKSKTEKKQRKNMNHGRKMEQYHFDEGEFEKKKTMALKEIEQETRRIKVTRDEMKELTEKDLLHERQHKQVLKTMKEKENALKKKLAMFQDHITTQCGIMDHRLQDL